MLSTFSFFAPHIPYRSFMRFTLVINLKNIQFVLQKDLEKVIL